MSAQAFLEDFGAGFAMHDQSAPDLEAEPKITEKDRLAAQDAGYKEGWEDAHAAASQERDHISAEFSRNLQDLSFTFHEARLQVTQSLQPLVEALCVTVFPRLSSLALADQVLAAIQPFAEEINTPSLDLLCAEGDADILQDLLASAVAPPLNMVVEPSLMRGQVKFALGHEVHQIDVTKLTEGIEEIALSQFRALAEPTSTQEFADVG